MKKFNIDFAKAGAPIRTRDGRSVRIICFDRVHDLPIVALVKRDDGTEVCAFYDTDGFYYGISDDSCDYDLVIDEESNITQSNSPKETIEKWVNIYQGNRLSNGILFNKREQAEKVGKQFSTYVTTAHVTWDK